MLHIRKFYRVISDLQKMCHLIFDLFYEKLYNVKIYIASNYYYSILNTDITVKINLQELHICVADSGGFTKCRSNQTIKSNPGEKF